MAIQVGGTTVIDNSRVVTSTGLTVDTDTLHVDTTNKHVGINTSSPTDALHIKDHDSGSVGTMKIGQDYHGYVQQLNNNLNLISNGDQAFRVGVGTNNGSGNITFQTANGTTGNTERMRVKADGTVLINTTSFFQSTKMGIEAPNIDVFSVRGNNIGAGYRYDSTSSTGLAAYFSHSSNTVACGSITIGSGSTSYNTSSDYRLKENVVELTEATERLKQLNPSRFNFIIDPDKTVDGFLAHEVQSIVPEAITGTYNEVDADGNPVYQGIDQSKLVPLLTAALQEAITKIEALETRLDALEA